MVEKEYLRLYPLPTTDEILFEFLPNFWHERYGSYLKEKTVNPLTKGWFYTHKRLRSSYHSLRRNLPYLFTFLKVKNMPNTTNSLDGFFGHLKDAVSIHRGLKLQRKTKLYAKITDMTVTNTLR